MRFLDETTGEIHRLFETAELKADLSAHQATLLCLHTETEVRRRAVSGGSIQIWKQCLKCGRAVSGPIKRTAEHDSSAAFDDSLERDFDAEREANHRTICLRHLDLQNRREASHQREYDTYLGSPAWADKRRKVLNRAHGKCEGCGEEPAEHIHHLTYKHLFDEFLFELVALCRACHKRIHEGEGESVDPDADFEPPCCACRWQDEKRGVLWCGKFDTSRADAMAQDGPCGPGQLGLEGLK